MDNQLTSRLIRLTDAEIILAPLAVLLLLFPTRLAAMTGALLLALSGVWLIRWAAWGKPFRAAPINLALLILLLSVLVAVWASAVPAVTNETLAYLLAGLTAFSAALHWTRTPGRAWWVWAGLMGIGMTLAALTPLGMRITAPKLFPLPGIYTHLAARLADRLPETINANVMAGGLVLLWPLALAGLQFPHSAAASLLSRLTSYALRLTSLLVTLLLLFTLALTQSRGAYAAAAVSGLVWLALRWPRAAAVVAPLVVIAALVGGSLLGWGVVADQLTAGDVTSGLDGRIEIWSRALYAIQDFPFTGSGLGTFEQVVAILYPLFMNPAGTVPHAHNLFLQTAVDLGLPGLAAYLAIFGLTFYCLFAAYRDFRRREAGGLSGLCAGCIAALAGMGVHGLIDAAVWGRIKLAFIPWAVMGLAAALYELARDAPGERNRYLNVH
jgi:putative inorganic carbon (hco3(-)) transporter